MISAIAWVKKGIAKAQPDRYELDESEYKRICELSNMNLESARQELEDAQASAERDIETTAISTENDKETAHSDADSELADFNMKDYDNEITTQQDLLFNSMGNNLAVFRSNDEDPYVKVPETDKSNRRDTNAAKDEVDVLDEEELEEALIDTERDNLILVGKTEDDISIVEVYVYNSADDDTLYVHHDFMIPSFPLCIAPIYFNKIKGARESCGRNFCAVGTFNNDIEVWNLDVMDAMYPTAILGAASAESSEQSSDILHGHSDAVLCLAWNHYAKNFLISGSADGTVIVWNLETGQIVNNLRNLHKQRKVSCIQFKDGWYMNTAQKQVAECSQLLTGGYDGSVCLVDVRRTGQEALICRWKVGSDVECIKWDPYSPVRFLAGCDDGRIHCFDASVRHKRKGGKALFTVDAHTNSLTAIDYNSFVPGMVLTSSATSADSLKLWDIQPDAVDKRSAVTFLGARDTGSGKVLSAQFCPDDPYLIAVGGSSGQLAIWNVTESRAIRERFHGRKIPSFSTEKAETFVRMDMEGLSIQNLLADANDSRESEPQDEDLDSVDEESADEMQAVLQEMKGVRGQQSDEESEDEQQ